MILTERVCKQVSKGGKPFRNVFRGTLLNLPGTFRDCQFVTDQNPLMFLINTSLRIISATSQKICVSGLFSNLYSCIRCAEIFLCVYILRIYTMFEISLDTKVHEASLKWFAVTCSPFINTPTHSCERFAGKPAVVCRETCCSLQEGLP